MLFERFLLFPHSQEMNSTSLIVCPEPLVCLGLRHLLVIEAGLRVCGETARSAEALQLRDLHKPDLTVVCAKHGEDLTLVRDLSKNRPKTSVLVVAHKTEPTQVHRALKAGALGYVMLEDEGGEVLRALTTVRSGGVYVSQRALGGLKLWQSPSSGPSQGIEVLSDRELEIFHLIGDGLRTKEIAYMLSISVKTVETHKQRMKEKLRLPSCSDLNRHASSSSGMSMNMNGRRRHPGSD